MGNLHTDRDVNHWTLGWAGVVVFLLFGGVVLWIATPVVISPPKSSEVSVAIGHVDSVQSLRGGVYFRLKESKLSFVHHSKAGKLGLLGSELAKPSPGVFTVTYRNVEPNTPLFLTGPYYTVIAMSVNDRQILSAQEIREGFELDNLVGVAIGGLCLILGMGRAAWLLRG